MFVCWESFFVPNTDLNLVFEWDMNLFLFCCEIFGWTVIHLEVFFSSFEKKNKAKTYFLVVQKRKRNFFWNSKDIIKQWTWYEDDLIDCIKYWIKDFVLFCIYKKIVCFALYFFSTRYDTFTIFVQLMYNSNIFFFY